VHTLEGALEIAHIDGFAAGVVFAVVENLLGLSPPHTDD
jgi:hypothetical protein